LSFHSARLWLAVSRSPAHPQAQEGERRILGNADADGMFRAIEHPRPFVEARRRNRAARGPVGVANSRLVAIDSALALIIRLPIEMSFSQAGTRPHRSCDNSRSPSAFSLV